MSKRSIVAAAPPPRLEDHQSELDQQYAEAEANRQRLYECLDPTIAADYETKKTLYEFKVECKLFRPARGRQHAHHEEISKNVVAQNENEAWAMFCDVLEEWPSPRDSQRTITKLRKRTLRADSED